MDKIENNVLRKEQKNRTIKNIFKTIVEQESNWTPFQQELIKKEKRKLSILKNSESKIDCSYLGLSPLKKRDDFNSNIIKSSNLLPIASKLKTNLIYENCNYSSSDKQNIHNEIFQRKLVLPFVETVKHNNIIDIYGEKISSNKRNLVRNNHTVIKPSRVSSIDSYYNSRKTPNLNSRMLILDNLNSKKVNNIFKLPIH